MWIMLEESYISTAAQYDPGVDKSQAFSWMRSNALAYQSGAAFAQVEEPPLALSKHQRSESSASG